MSEQEQVLGAFSRKDKKNALTLLSTVRVHPSIIRDDSNWTLLHHASNNNWPEVCKLLVDKYQLDPHWRSNTGSTALHRACSQNNLEVVRYLVLDCCADPLVKDNYGHTPLERSSGESRKFLQEIIDTSKKKQFSDVPSYLKHRKAEEEAAKLRTEIQTQTATLECQIQEIKKDKALDEEKLRLEIKELQEELQQALLSEKQQLKEIQEIKKDKANDEEKLRLEIKELQEELQQALLSEKQLKEMSGKHSQTVKRLEHQIQDMKKDRTNVEERFQQEIKELEGKCQETSVNSKKQQDEHNETVKRYEEDKLKSKKHQQKLELQITELKQEVAKVKDNESTNKLIEQKSDVKELTSQLEKNKVRIETLDHQLQEEQKRSIELLKKINRLTVDDLCTVLTAVHDLQPQWQELGLSLGLSLNELDKIATTHTTSVCRCLYQVLRHWLTRIGGSWERLSTALRTDRVKREDVAETIEHNYITEGIKSHKGGLMNLIIINQNDMPLTEEDNLDEVFESVDWRVLGLLLGISDNDLEQICVSYLSSSECQNNMLKKWMSTKQAYWSILVNVLKGPVLDEVELASSITKAHLVAVVEGSYSSGNEQTIENQLPINESEIELIHAEIGHTLNHSETPRKKSEQPKGIIFIFGISGADGTDVDVNNIHSTFKNEFHFATFRRENLTPSHLITHLKAAATFKYPVSCKYKAFYFAGHGGIDQNQQPYFNAVHDNKGSEVISIQKNILTFFEGTHYKKTDSFIFFFDCCLSSADSHSSTTKDRKPFAFEIPKRCLVAFATSPGQRSAGTNEKGGIWTSLFCKHLMEVKKAETLTAVLDRTHKAVVENSKESQPPQYFSCVGPVYLKGPPESEHAKTQKSFHECCNELIESLSASELSAADGLAYIFCNDGIIDKKLRGYICAESLNKKERATKLFNGLEQAITKQPEIMPKILGILKSESCLENIVLKISAGKGQETEDLADLYKSLNQSVQKAEVLKYENEKLKEEMKRIKEERRKNEEILKNKLLDDARIVYSEAVTQAMTQASQTMTKKY